jgi:hypothetical protein
MKSKIYLILFALFAFSCSSDSSSDDGNNNNGGNNNSGNSLLVSEIISTDAEDPDYVYTDRFFYNDGDGLDGNKITSSTSEYSYSNGQSYLQNTSNFIYTNNRIARVDTFDGSSNNMVRQVEFDYDSQGRLTTIERCSYGNGTCYDQTSYSFSYSNNNNTITETYSSSYEGQLESYGTAVWQLNNNGNITSATDENNYDYDGDGTFTQDDVNLSFEHDNFNSPFSNIAGVDARVLFEMYRSSSSFWLGLGAFNNLTGADVSFVQNPSDNYTVSIAYDYNEDGYPRQAIISESDFDSDSVLTINYY